MDWKLGEIFEFGGEWYQCVKSPDGSCKHCDMNFGGKCPIPIKECVASSRSDLSYVIFKKLEKVGEPYMDGGKIMQKYKRVYREPIYFPYKELNCYNDLHGRICIEIKQNKEDMEEKKPTYEELLHYYHSTMGLWAIDKNPQEVSLDWICDNAFQLGIDEKDSNSEKIGKNLKPFDLQAAKAGKPVCTRDGRMVRIICFDAKDNLPIIALITNERGDESLARYKSNGRFINLNESDCDLMMLPEKKEGWVNVCRNLNTNKTELDTTDIYDTKEEALQNLSSMTYITTVKIEWEE